MVDGQVRRSIPIGNAFARSAEDSARLQAADRMIQEETARRVLQEQQVRDQQVRDQQERERRERELASEQERRERELAAGQERRRRIELARKEEAERLHREQQSRVVDCRPVPGEMRVIVKTGDISKAGTDANITLVVYGKGSCGNAARAVINRFFKGVDAFERNQTDDALVTFDSVVYVPEAIEISHDGWGASPDWYCEWIEINGTRFKVNQWISGGQTVRVRK